MSRMKFVCCGLESHSLNKRNSKWRTLKVRKERVWTQVWRMLGTKRDTGSVQRGQDGGPEPSGESVGRGEGVLLSDPRPHHVSRVALVDTQCSDTHIPVALSTNKTHRVSPWSRIAKADIQSDTHVSSVTNVSALSRGALSREISTGTTALAHASIVVRDPTEGPLREWRGYA